MGIYGRDRVVTEAHSRDAAYKKVKRSYPRSIVRATGIKILKETSLEDVNTNEYIILK